MKRILVLALVGGILGCVESNSDDPSIKAKRRIEYPGGGVNTPVGGAGYQHGAREEQYEGPASKAPDWAKPSPAPKSK